MSTLSPRTVRNFWLILLLALVSVFINLPSSIPLKINLGPIKVDKTITKPSIGKPLDLKYGLDLAGGASLTYDIDTTKISKDDLKDALESLKSNIERRVNLFGVSESNVMLSNQNGQNRLVVELPGVEDIDSAIGLIGQTAQLSFKGVKDVPPEATATATFEDVFAETGITGSNLVKALPQPNPNTGQMEVSLEFDSEGSKLFEKATKDFLNKKIAILLDNQIITAPVVQTVISDGKAVINGSFDTESAKTLSAQLNAGALPLPITLIQQTQVGATLGQDSIQKGIIAGVLGLVLVALFMIGNYGYLGFVADIGLIIYGLITLSLYRLIPVTLTFPGIVGFILSIGMAVDSNILIFERMREELRLGKPLNIAMELGFGRAWDSIRDANTCTIITGLILFNPFNWTFLNTSGMVRGFAVTLLLGIIIGIFTGVFVTRNLLRVFVRQK